MDFSRRGFLKLTSAGVVGLSLGQLGLDLKPATAYAAGLKIEGAKESISICPFCSCGCNFLVHSKGGKIVSTEGDPDYPVSEGSLCCKGAAMLSMHVGGHRITKPMYRAPYSDKWEEKDWDWMYDRIARKIKDTRDKYFIEKNDKGQVVNRCEAIFQAGTSQMDNEECAVHHHMLRALGMVNMDHQARICHSATVPALAESFGRGAMTNHWIDIKNANAILIMGGKAAENHPISFKWVLKAKAKGAVVMHVDPVFNRTSARADFHVPLRSGTDIAFLGGMIHYILENDKYFKEYVVNYTNAPMLVNSGFGFQDGLFTGYDSKSRTYDKATWTFQMDENGIPIRDESLQDPNSVFQLLKKHYSRYTLDKVSDITGVPQDKIIKVYEAYTATGTKNKAGTIMYALGWTQHTVGVQNIRTSAMVQLLLGNIGIAGGGINALRGEPNVQGSTDQAILWHILPGYNPVPKAGQDTLEQYLDACTPVSHDPKSANWWQHRPEYVVSLLKAWYGDAATKDNDFCYSWVPKCDPGEDYSYIYFYDRMYKEKIKGGFVFAHNPCQSVPNTHKARRAMDNLEWLVVGEIHHTETSDNWQRPGVDPKKVQTEVFLLPSAQRGEKDGSITNSGRWLMWHYAAVPPIGDCKTMGDMIVDIMNRVKGLYAKEGGAFPEPLVNMAWPEKYDAEAVAKQNNGFFTRDAKVGSKSYSKGQQVPSFTALASDGSTACYNWLFGGSYTEEGGNKAKRRDLSQNDLDAKLGLFPNFSWAWPVNRRILYNRASVDPQGKPWNPEMPVISWNGEKWVGDVPDGGWAPMAHKDGKYPFIMHTHGFGQLFGPGRVDGPFPEHYEPVETPVKSHPFSKQLNSPCYKFVESDMDVLTAPADPKFPIVLTTYAVTEHWCGGAETRNTPNLLEAEPQSFVEISHELAEEKGITNGDVVIVESARGKVEAVAMVTVRMTPFKIQGRTVHEVGMPYSFGWTTPGCGDATNRLTPSVGDSNTGIPEYKCCLVNVRKADKVTELARK
ncbi:formate dehydrogenase-N subunit alpha [Oceanidesulfovibrio marinus]|uniref:Formate dehydrogenase-N subunit alpha n=1 Tax=Oceanidesulfovibrio marinus TaxID=370038 RepID=A0ABX6NFB8_9BACT|nr:formate dehydrogenase-N subunit alpha [Oceanidesulfovibrio marinus]QJT08991.1 formate dehydrogenase-N subunit alpha [Oceanidesulfovibrio marinus]